MKSTFGLKTVLILITLYFTYMGEISAQTNNFTLAPGAIQQKNSTKAVRKNVQDHLLENLTWPELAAKLKEGYTTVIVPTGGTEQGGPQLTMGKHNFIVQYAAMRVAQEVGLTLVAPILPFVPEGGFERPSGNLLYPGTIALSEDTFAKSLIDISTSLYMSGFKLIVLMADHGQSMPVQELVAQNLTKAWEPYGVRVVNLNAYYDASIEAMVLNRAGIIQSDWGDHAGVADTSELWFVRPEALRPKLLKSLTKDSGATGKPELASALLGREMMDLRVKAGTQQLRTFITSRH